MAKCVINRVHKKEYLMPKTQFFSRVSCVDLDDKPSFKAKQPFFSRVRI